jgi:hypothetical protein
MANFAQTLAKSLRQSRGIIYFSLQMILVLLGALLASTLGSVGVAVGTSIIATGVSGMVVFGWVILGDAEGDKRRAADAFGFVTAFPNRSVQIKSEYDIRLGRASKRIDIMGFGLNSLREDYAGSFRSWASRAEVRILLVDPESPRRQSSYADLRDREEGNNPGRTSEEIMRFIDDTRNLWEDSDISFSLRLAKTIPSVNIFRIDEESFWGPYLISQVTHGRTSRNLPTLVVRSPGYMFDRLVDHFEEIWNSDQLSRSPG